MKKVRWFECGETVTQLAYTFAASLIFASAGALLAWPGPALPRLQRGDAAAALSASQGAWAVAALHAGQLLGAAPGGFLAARLGRRRALLCSAPPMLLAWLATAFAAAPAPLLGARALGGAAVGVAFAAGPLYVAEAASARLRGAAGALPQLALSAGQLLAYCGGAWLSLRALALLAAALPAAFAAAFWAAPETPAWLLRRGRRAEAARALRALRGPRALQAALDAELLALEAFACAEAAPLDVEGRCAAAGHVLGDPPAGRVALLVLCLLLLQAFGGVGAFLPYSSYDIHELSLSEDVGWIVMGSVLLAASFAAVCLLARCGRRPALVVSSSAAAIAHAVHVVSLRAARGTTGGSATALSALYVAAAAHALALGPLPLALAAEMAPAHARGAIAGLGAAAVAVFWWLAARLHQSLCRHGNAYISFYLSTACCGLAAWLSAAQLPETKGRTLQQVQAALCGKGYTKTSSALLPAPLPPAGASSPAATPEDADSETVWDLKLWKLHIVFQRPKEPPVERAEMQHVATESAAGDGAAADSAAACAESRALHAS